MNQTIFYFFYNLAHWSNFFDHVVILFGVWFPYIVIFLAGIFLLMHHEVFKVDSTFAVFLEKKKEILKAFVAGILAWIFAYILKLLFHTPRPFDALPGVHPIFPESGFSFPSGHATFFMALAVSIFFFHRKAGYFFMFCALLIGIARIIGGVHFPVDILGGFILGALVAYFTKNV
ncbi:MAG TPA: phosphatase PAP2 family protein [Candidatus Paceibacterota bacterium]|jgi:undecaprenyl-diphosphatase|nr:phosphatase PAP2 family protein [Candidatus Paceibacterota bacterium]